VLKIAYFNHSNNAEELQKHIQILKEIQQREENLKQSLETVKNLKVAFIHSYFRDNSKRG
jgi:cation transport regulator ChaC